MSFLNPNYTEPCLSWCSSPFTPAAWRACTFQSSSPQINWVFFPSSHLLTSFGSQRLSLVELRLLEDGETVMHQTAGMSFGDSVLSAPLSPRCVQSREEIHTADQSLTENDKHFSESQLYCVYHSGCVDTGDRRCLFGFCYFYILPAFTKSLFQGFGPFIFW